MNTVEERTPLLRYARRARARLAFVRGLEWALRAAFYAGLVALAAVASHKLFGVPMPATPAAIGLGAAVLFVGILCAFVPAVTLVEAAGAVDAAAGWKERLSSALALGRVDHPMEQALVDDIRARLGQRAPSDLFPWRAPRELRFLPLVVVAIIVAARFVPSLDLFGVQAREKEKREQEKEIAVAIEKLKDQRRELEKAKEHQPTERLQQALAKIDQLMAELQKNPPPEKQEMLAQISKLADELQKMKNELAQAQAQAEKLQKAASKETAEQGEFGKLLKEGKFKEAAQELAKLQKKMQDGKLSKEDQEKLEKQLERLAEKLKNEKDMSDLKDKMAKAMQGAEKGDQQAMDDLKQSLESLDGEMDEAESLAEALKDLENLAEAMAKDKKKCPS